MRRGLRARVGVRPRVEEGEGAHRRKIGMAVEGLGQV